MTSGSLGRAVRAASVHFQSSFYAVSCWYEVSRKTGFSSAMPVDSMLTSIGSVEMSSLIFRIFFFRVHFQTS